MWADVCLNQLQLISQILCIETGSNFTPSRAIYIVGLIIRRNKTLFHTYKANVVDTLISMKFGLVPMHREGYDVSKLDEAKVSLTQIKSS